MKRKRINLSPARLLIISFFVMLGIGTTLLMLPWATTQPITWTEAAFTTTSAITVTGLAVVDTGTIYTLFGQFIIMLLIQIGGLGYVTIAMMIFIFLGRKMGFKERLMLKNSLNVTDIGGIIRLAKGILFIALFFELVGALLLSFIWVPEFGLGKGLWFSLFHSVSAFNNAGFGLLPNNLMNYVDNPIINTVIPALFIFGGLGFTVLLDIYNKRKWQFFSLHTKMMLIGTIVFIFIAMFFMLIVEWQNPKTLGPLSLEGKLWSSFFHGTSIRTAGFNTIDLEFLQTPTLLMMMLMMFIGAGSVSTAGGIKLTTFIVILIAVFHYIRGKKDMVVFRRTLPQELVFKVLSITIVAIAFVFTSILLLSFTEQAPLRYIAFETFSAFGTVGLSLNFSMTLSFLGKWIIIFMMFLGKVGPLTLLFSFSRQRERAVRYPEEQILTG
ncbi:MAG: TrkH family potassium uptake protein [Bacilli bacterium]